MMRSVAVVGGILILAAVAHVTVLHTGGYFTPHSWLTIAVAAGVGVASVCSGLAWAADRRWLALCLIGAPVDSRAADRGTRGAAGPAPGRPGRLRDSPQARLGCDRGPGGDARDVRTIEHGAGLEGRGGPCGNRQEQRAGMRGELPAPAIRAGRDGEQGCRGGAWGTRCVALGVGRRIGVGTYGAGNPQGARLGFTPGRPAGLAPWVLDLVTAALGSIAANGLAAALLVFASHGHKVTSTADEDARR